MQTLIGYSPSLLTSFVHGPPWHFFIFSPLPPPPSAAPVGFHFSGLTLWKNNKSCGPSFLAPLQSKLTRSRTGFTRCCGAFLGNAMMINIQTFEHNCCTCCSVAAKTTSGCSLRSNVKSSSLSKIPYHPQRNATPQSETSPLFFSASLILPVSVTTP